MYQPNYSGFSQSMRPPSHPHGPPPLLHIQTSAAPQSRYQQYTYGTPSAANMANVPAPAQQPPPSPSEQSEKTVEEDYYNLPPPPGTSHIWNNCIWSLEIVQHPSRARMCGFGDKDRRPISPPPCIRLKIVDSQTMEEIDYTEIDLTHLVLTVDIWDLHSTRELNLVKQSNASPCISSAATGAFPTQSAHPPPGHQQPPVYHSAPTPPYNNGFTPVSASPSTANPYYPQSAQSYTASRSPYVNGQGSQSGHPSPHQNGPPPFRPTQYPTERPHNPYGDPRYESPYQPGFSGTLPPIGSLGSLEQSYLHNHTPTTQLYTRNLIGSLCASAFRLKDQTEKVGIWFVLQDLSVRTEGWFRLKMNFFHLAQAVEKSISDATNGTSDGKTNGQAKSTAPCLAAVYSLPFKVYSAKKFPGVVESTPLSKAFANQGIKIPIRKDTGGKRAKGDGSDDEANSDDS